MSKKEPDFNDFSKTEQTNLLSVFLSLNFNLKKMAEYKIINNLCKPNLCLRY